MSKERDKVSKSIYRTMQDEAAVIWRRDGLLTVFVGSAGIGRLGYKAWQHTEEIDRQDGSDEKTYDTPGEALRALADRLDKETLQLGWRLSQPEE